jgi:hypothetical protein
MFNAESTSNGESPLDSCRDLCFSEISLSFVSISLFVGDVPYFIRLDLFLVAISGVFKIFCPLLFVY